MQITRIYADEAGDSWFEDIELETKPKGPGLMSTPFGVMNFTIRETPGPSTQDWHVAPKKVYVVLLSGAVEIEVSGGVTRQFTAGDVLLAEDTYGKGHKTTTISEGVRKTLFIVASDAE